MASLETKSIVISLLSPLNSAINIYKENEDRRNSKKRLLSAKNVSIVFS
jgi:cation transport regulator ChaB